MPTLCCCGSSINILVMEDADITIGPGNALKRPPVLRPSVPEK